VNFHPGMLPDQAYLEFYINILRLKQIRFLQLEQEFIFFLLNQFIFRIIKARERVSEHFFIYLTCGHYSSRRNWNTHLGSISPTYLRAAFTHVAPKSVRVGQVINIF